MTFNPRDPRWNQPKDDGRPNEERRRQLAPAIRGFADGGLEVYQAEDGSLWYDPQALKELLARDQQWQQLRLSPKPLSRSPSHNSLASNRESMSLTSERGVNANG